jgi:hypothetical protein
VLNFIRYRIASTNDRRSYIRDCPNYTGLGWLVFTSLITKTFRDGGMSEVDIVFVVDASNSMAPCFSALAKHLASVLAPLQGHCRRINFGLLAQSALKERGGEARVFHHQCLTAGADVLELVYRQRTRAPLFTDDPESLAARLEEITPAGDEDMLIALDTAADFPFGPLGSTKRVIALFSDEPFETGAFGKRSNDKLPPLGEKLMARHIQLFAAIPMGEGAEYLSTVDRAEIEIVDSGAGLAAVNFSRLLDQMGRSISASALQATGPESWRRALFGQTQWAHSEGEPGQLR